MTSPLSGLTSFDFPLFCLISSLDSAEVDELIPQSIYGNVPVVAGGACTAATGRGGRGRGGSM